MSQLAKDSTITLISRIIYLILALVTNIVIARQLGPSLQGTYQVVILVLNTTNLFFLFGLSSANVFLGARQPEQLPFMVGNSIIAALFLGIFAIFILEILIQFTPFRQYLTENGIPIQLLQFVLLMIPLMLMWSYLREIIHATGHITIYNLLSISQILIQLCLLIMLFTINEDKLLSAIYAWAISYILQTILTIYLALKVVSFQFGINWQIFKQSISFGLRNHGGAITQFLNYRLDFFIIGIFFAPAYIGYYSIATLYAERMWEIPTAIRTALMYHAASDESNAAMMTARVSRVVSFIVGLLCLLMMLFSYPFIYILYGESYLPAVTAMILLMPSVWAFSIGKLLAVYIASENRPEIGALTGFISLIVTVILDILLIPQMGIAGAAIASSISYMVSSIIIVYVFLRMSNLELKNVLFIHRQDISYMMRMMARIRQR